MALDARHRSSIYQKLVPLLGDDDTNALMTQFPSIEADELVTKHFLRAELAELRLEMAEMGSTLRLEMAEMESRLMLRLGAAIAASTTITVAAVGILT